jgi:hypothetical protein
MKNIIIDHSAENQAEVKRTPQFYRARKALLFLPLLVLPLLTLGFANFHHAPKGQATETQSHGLNASVPGAKFDKHEKTGNKMSFYDQVKQDSIHQQSTNSNPALQQFGFKPDAPRKVAATNMGNTALPTTYTDPNVVKINQKLADINKQISQPQALNGPVMNAVNTNKPMQDKEMAAQISKLETLMKSMNSSQGNDPQMQQLSKMLEQIQEIQHPELVKPTVKQTQASADSLFKAIPATIDGNQKVLQGGIVKLKLNDTIRVKGLLIPKGQLFFGNATITNQRLLLEIKNIRMGNAIIPVNLVVYSLDGLPGINAPEAELAGAAGSGADNAISNMEFLSMDQSLATQAAAGGITAAKGLFSKKVRKVKVHLKNGYPILLRDNNRKGV